MMRFERDDKWWKELRVWSNSLVRGNSSYRESNEEAAYTLDNKEINHGTFLEVVKLLQKYDSCTADHLSHIVHNSKKQHEKAKSSWGQGSLVTLLSKTTVNCVITVIWDKIRQWISVEVTDMFAVEIDTTQDISTQDHCSVVARYVDSTGTILRKISECGEMWGIYWQSFCATCFWSHVRTESWPQELCLKLNWWCSKHAGALQRPQYLCYQRKF